MAGQIRYINEVGSDGWVAGADASGVRIPLCKYTKVEVRETRNHRTQFQVLDGPRKGAVLDMDAHQATRYFGATPPQQGLAALRVKYGHYQAGWVSVARHNQLLDQQFAELQVADVQATVTMNTVWGREFTPLPAGSYKVFAPDGPHDRNMTAFYRNFESTLSSDQLWFPIDVGNRSRYVHVGNVSEGCVTVASLDKWARICEALVSHRSTDGRYVATLTVTGAPERSR